MSYYTYYGNIMKMITIYRNEKTEPMLDKEKFNELFKMDNYIIIDSNKGRYIFIGKKSKVLKTSKHLANFISKNKKENTAVILDDKISNTARDIMHGIKIYFSYRFDQEYPKYSKMPKHEIVTDEKELELLKDGGDLTSLPKIHKNEVMMIWLNAKKGDIVKITRMDDYNKYTTYRFVIGDDPNL